MPLDDSELVEVAETVRPVGTWFITLFNEDGFSTWVDQSVGAVGLIVVALIGVFITRGILTPLLRTFFGKTKNEWDDLLFQGKFLGRISWLGGTAVLSYGPYVLWGENLPMVADVLGTAANAVQIMCVAAAISALLEGVNQIYNRREIAKTRPIKGYLQIVSIIIYGGGLILTIATLLDKDPIVLFTGLGALTAVLMLVFKDTILSLVASIQLTSNDMLRVGDWLEMPSVGADGDVIDIALHTVKVQNWDKTISTIPTHKLISSTFKNWRGMSESGGRRIKRSVSIDMNTIGFLDEEQIDRFGRYELLNEYMAEKRAALDEHNQRANDDAIISNRRRLTNIGTFRAWVIAYLRQHEQIHQTGMTFLVRQLPPGETGLPIEIYLFTTTTNWVEYEAIQGDIFDHLLAILPEFGLRPYQAPSGADFQRLGVPADS